MPQFAATTKLLERDLEKVNPDQAVKNIETWEESLNGLESKSAKAVAKDLEALKKALTGKPRAGSVEKLLAKLGQETTRLADEAPEAQQEKLRDIGKALTEAGGTAGAESVEA
jgi:hypothetical protein